MKFLAAFSLVFVITVILWWWFFGPVSRESRPGIFSVPEKMERLDVAQQLKNEGYIRYTGAFRLLMGVAAFGKTVKPGGYRLNPTMHALAVLKKITAEPELVWVTTSGCLRKEQVGEILTQKLGWDDEKLKQWNTIVADTQSEYFDGVYYPDTYLIPRDESAADIARRFISRFQDKITPLMDEFIKQNIKWTTVLKIASLIEREAAGLADMRLISGIIWNRLDKGMKLEIDATMQYTRGKRNGAWWGAVDLTEKGNGSPYNTYRHKGLPPTPICSPGLEAIRAVIEPEETACLYYLHDRDKQIHCAKTYAEHLANIQRYLR